MKKYLGSYDEYQAKAMLLGLEYDPRDHTMVGFYEAGVRREMTLYDPDTLEVIHTGNLYRTFEDRINDVNTGKNGPAWLKDMPEGERDKLWLE